VEEEEEEDIDQKIMSREPLCTSTKWFSVAMTKPLPYAC
jgi:hypothetical protein